MSSNTARVLLSSTSVRSYRRRSFSSSTSAGCQLGWRAWGPQRVQGADVAGFPPLRHMRRGLDMSGPASARPASVNTEQPGLEISAL